MAAKARVVIVDGDKHVGSALAAQLEQLGATAGCCRTGKQALALLAERPADALLVDAQTLGAGFGGLLDRVKAIPSSPPVVVMASPSALHQVRELIGLGAADFILKPWARQELASALSSALGRPMAHAAAPRQRASGGDLEQRLQAFDPETLASDPSVIIGVRSDFTIGYFNPAYLRFAEQNGAPDIARRFGPGSSLLAALPEPVKEFYVSHLEGALQSGQPWEHDYDCDSPTVARSFRLMALPLGQSGLLLIHSLRRASSRPETPLGSSMADYEDGGMVLQCCHCRRLNRPSNRREWDFVPEALDSRFSLRISHGLCHPCSVHHYSS